MTNLNLVFDRKSDLSMQRYMKNTRLGENFDVLKNDLFSNSHANIGRF